MPKERLRVATYNVHKCKGLDGRTRPERVARVLAELQADVVALQEVVGEQAMILAEALEPRHYWLGENRKLRGAAYGNAVLSRFPIVHMHNFDITQSGREKRGCMRVDLDLGRKRLHVFNVHLGTSFFERRYQGDRLVAREILLDPELRAPRLVLGDFNEWTRGKASTLLRAHFDEVDSRRLGRRKTYPGLLPLVHLDHIYFERGMRLCSASLHRSRLALVASDHLPLVAEFELTIP